MTAVRCLMTLSAGHWHIVPAPGPEALRLGETIEGFAVLVDIDDSRRTVRLVRPLRYGNVEARLAQWARLHGYRVVPTAPARIGPAVLTARPRPTL